MMTISIPLTSEEKQLAASYAKRHSLSVSDAFKRALFDQIEEEYSQAVFEDAYREYKENGRQSRPVSKLWKELEI